MKAVVVEAFGGPENLQFRDVDTPKLKPHEALVGIEFAGVGFVDVMAREGRYRFTDPGFIPGLEVIGIVIDIGNAVDQRWLKRRVVAFPSSGGGYAQYIAVKEGDLIDAPESISPQDALAIGLNGLVAAFSLSRAGVRSGDQVLIRGAGGGIGQLATQLAAGLGAEVTVTTSSISRGRRLQELGAARTWNRLDDPALRPHSFDVVVDAVAGSEVSPFLNTLRDNGRYVICGGIEGSPAADFGKVLMENFHRSPSFFALSLNSITSIDRSKALTDLFSKFSAGEIVSVIDSVSPLSEAHIAHGRLESGASFGKILLASLGAELAGEKSNR